MCVWGVSVLLSWGLSSSSQLKPLFTSLEARGEGQLPEPPALQAGEAVPAWGQGDGVEQRDQWNNYLGLPGVCRTKLRPELPLHARCHCLLPTASVRVLQKESNFRADLGLRV